MTHSQEQLMETSQHGEVMQSIGELKGLITGIQNRLDYANGRTSKLEAKIEILEKNQNKSDGRLSAYGWIFGAIIGFGGLILAAMQFYISAIKK